MVVLLVPIDYLLDITALTVPQQLPNTHKSKGVNENMYTQVYGGAMAEQHRQGAMIV
jgi:hypothetical protein